MLQDLALEVAYPRFAIRRLGKRDVSGNASTMSSLFSGEGYRVWRGGSVMFDSAAEDLAQITGAERDDWFGRLEAGSSAEGLAMEFPWGHPPADRDDMLLFGEKLGVYVPGSPTPRGAACLEYHPEGCPPAYCKLEVIDLTALRQTLHNYTHGWFETPGQVPEEVLRCTTTAGGHKWLDTYHTVRLMKDKDIAVSGPAQQHGLTEYIISLVCSGPHPELQREFRQRSRQQWPPDHVIEDILKLPVLLVLVGHKLSKNFKGEGRISWSHCEIKIMQELPESVRQGYIACKYVLKRFLAIHRGQRKSDGGRSRVCSFHIKTVFLHYLEKRTPAMIASPFGLFVDLLYNLDRYLELGKLPHYFLAECDLLETVDGEERRIARQAIQSILSDPLAALLTSPTSPRQIYGEVHPDALVNSFRRVINHPMCQQGRKDLSVLLARVDECRHKRCRQQLDEDRSFEVTGRPGMTGLVEVLEQIRYT